MTKWLVLPTSVPWTTRSWLGFISRCDAATLACEGATRADDIVAASTMATTRETIRLRRIALPLGDVARVCRRDSNPAAALVGTTRTDYRRGPRACYVRRPGTSSVSWW